MSFVTDPKILTHPNIPKPLHGLSPRALKGKAWWDRVRHAAYESTDYKCLACGIHKTEAKGPKWLEAHEYWDIDYQKGICKVEKIIPLCHYCHNFIHSGRLYMIVGIEKPKQECIEILEHGFKILKDNKLKCFYNTLEIAEILGANTFKVKAAKIKVNPEIKWGDWKLILEGQEYHSKFKDALEWLKYYREERF